MIEQNKFGCRLPGKNDKVPAQLEFSITRSGGGRGGGKQINCLVLAPTRELATQIQVNIATLYCQGLYDH